MDTPAELLEFLDDCSVRLFIGIEQINGREPRKRVRVVADPHGVVDDTVRRRLTCWEPELLVALDRRRKGWRESPWPDTVSYAKNAAGLPVLRYPRPDGSTAMFILRLDGTWFPCSPKEVPDV